MKGLLLHCSKELSKSQFTLVDLLPGIVSGFLTAISVVIAAYLAYRYSVKRLKNDTHIELEREKYKRRIFALEACWKLLIYTTTTENEQCVLTWEPGANKIDKTYFLRQIQASKFIKELAEFFYASGFGIYITSDIKKRLFEYRSLVYGVLQSVSNEENIITLTNKNMVQRLIQIHEELLELLKSEIDQSSVQLKKIHHEFSDK